MTRTCEIPGCRRKHNARGLCVAHYGMWLKHGNPLYADQGLHLPSLGKSPNTSRDFWKKVDIKDSMACWLWQKGKDGDGYGMFCYYNRMIRAHRFVAEYILGWKIGGLCVCHKCDTPSCVNPEHLFLGTSADNTLDRDVKGRGVRGERCHSAVLTEQDVLQLRAVAKTEIRRSELARKFGISRSQVNNILRGESWKHLL